MTALRPVDEAFIADLRERGTAPSEPTVTAMQLVAESGLTYRMCDYFVRTGRLVPIVPAFGSGTQRRFTIAEAKIARIIRRLLDAGLCLPVAHDAARARKPGELVDIGPGLALIVEDEDGAP